MQKLFDVLGKNVSLLGGVIYFLIFAYDIENDRDYWTWMWLLNSILSFVFYIIKQIKNGKVI